MKMYAEETRDAQLSAPPVIQGAPAAPAMSYRQYAAAQCMAGLAPYTREDDINRIARRAVRQADALVAALNGEML